MNRGQQLGTVRQVMDRDGDPEDASQDVIIGNQGGENTRTNRKTGTGLRVEPSHEDDTFENHNSSYSSTKEDKSFGSTDGDGTDDAWDPADDEGDGLASNEDDGNIISPGVPLKPKAKVTVTTSLHRRRIR